MCALHFRRHRLRVVLVVKKDFSGLFYPTHIRNSYWLVSIYLGEKNNYSNFFFSRNFQREQLASHEGKVAQLTNELTEHKRNAPPSKGLQLQNYIEKDTYLQYEVNIQFITKKNGKCIHF